MPNNNPGTADSLRRTLKKLVIATAILYLAMAGIAIYIYRVSQDNAEGLCAFRNEAQQRVDQSKAYLKKHPNGTKEIPAGIIKTGIHNAEQTVKALSGISCPAPPKLGPERTDTTP